jgi:hypothetical protein
MADSHDPDGDPGQRHTHHSDDPELEKVREDTANIFVQFVRLHSHSASSNAAVIDHISTDLSSPTESPSSSTRQCLQLAHESSRKGAAATGPSTLPRQKSTEAATRKDPHPKAVYSTTRQPALLVPNHHCSVSETSTQPVSSGSNSTRANRPEKLSLGRVYERVPSATGSDNSSGKTTPAQDPPMELMSPGGGELSSSYPPPSSTAQSDRSWLTRSAGPATVAAASQASCTTSSQEKERHLSSVVSTMHASCWLYLIYLLQFPACSTTFCIFTVCQWYRSSWRYLTINTVGCLATLSCKVI